MFSINLSGVEREALINALDNYLSGVGMEEHDVDEAILDNILTDLALGPS